MPRCNWFRGIGILSMAYGSCCSRWFICCRAWNEHRELSESSRIRENSIDVHPNSHEFGYGESTMSEKPEEIEMPEPTGAPMILGVGIVLLGAGVALNRILPLVRPADFIAVLFSCSRPL